MLSWYAKPQFFLIVVSALGIYLSSCYIALRNKCSPGQRNFQYTIAIITLIASIVGVIAGIALWNTALTVKASRARINELFNQAEAYARGQ